MSSRPPLPLLAAVLGLAALLLVDAVSRRGAAPAPAAAGPAPSASAGARPDPAVAERELRRVARERLLTQGPATYLDSLLLMSDSVIRRWDGEEPVLRFALESGGVEGWAPTLAAEVRDAARRWSPNPVRFEEVGDTATAQVVIRWTDQFPFRRAGQTDLFWDAEGQLYRARVTLALRTERGVPLPAEARFAVALHELGHVLGLPHSADSADVMFEATRATDPSPRDLRTLYLLYELPLGLVREPRAPQARPRTQP